MFQAGEVIQPDSAWASYLVATRRLSWGQGRSLEQIIVCWEHNWPECPLEVIELKKEIAKIGKSKTLPLINTDDTDRNGE
jgi:hypothetical protein